MIVMRKRFSCQHLTFADELDLLKLMPDPEIIKYIKEELARGVSKETITNNLLAKGWQEPQISEALTSLNFQNTQQKPFEPLNVNSLKKKRDLGVGISSRNIFLFICLTTLMFFAIKFYSTYYYYSATQKIGVSFIYSSVLIVFIIVNFYFQEQILKSAGILKNDRKTLKTLTSFSGYFLLFISISFSFFYFAIMGVKNINYFSALLIVVFCYLTPFTIAILEIKLRNIKSIIVSVLSFPFFIILYFFIFAFYGTEFGGLRGLGNLILLPIFLLLAIVALFISTPLFIKNLKNAFKET